MEKGTLPLLDGILRERGYKSRSQAISDFVRRALARRQWAHNRECAGVISIFYREGSAAIAGKMEKIKASNAANIISWQSSLLEGNVFTAISVRGRPPVLEKLADSLRGVKGVRNGSFSLAAPLE